MDVVIVVLAAVVVVRGSALPALGRRGRRRHDARVRRRPRDLAVRGGVRRRGPPPSAEPLWPGRGEAAGVSAEKDEGDDEAEVRRMPSRHPSRVSVLLLLVSALRHVVYGSVGLWVCGPVGLWVCGSVVLWGVESVKAAPLQRAREALWLAWSTPNTECHEMLLRWTEVEFSPFAKERETDRPTALFPAVAGTLTGEFFFLDASPPKLATIEKKEERRCQETDQPTVRFPTIPATFTGDLVFPRRVSPKIGDWLEKERKEMREASSQVIDDVDRRAEEVILHA